MSAGRDFLFSTDSNSLILQMQCDVFLMNQIEFDINKIKQELHRDIAILDIGSDRLEQAVNLAYQGHSVTAICRSEEIMKKMQQGYSFIERLKLIYTDYSSHLSLTLNEQFDVIYSLNHLQSLTDFEVELLLIDMIQSLKPGGMFAIFWPIVFNANTNLFNQVSGFLELFSSDPLKVNMLYHEDSIFYSLVGTKKLLTQKLDLEVKSDESQDIQRKAKRKKEVSKEYYEERLNKWLANNRKSAQAYRNRRKSLVQSLEGEIRELNEKNKKLREEIKKEEATNKSYKEELAFFQQLNKVDVEHFNTDLRMRRK